MSLSNLDEYLTPEIYDAEYGNYSADIDFFVGLKADAKALDLACGTGRLTIPLARCNAEVTGIDASLPMLARARKKSNTLGIRYIAADIRNFHLNEKFEVITLAGNSFQALLTDNDQQRMLTCVRNHLSSNGIFAFNTRNTLKSELITNDSFDYWHQFMDNKGIAVKVYGKQAYDAAQKIVHYVTKRVWPDHENISNIKLRFTSPADLTVLLKEQGFQVKAVYGDFDKTPFTATSSSIIVVCHLR